MRGWPGATLWKPRWTASREKPRSTGGGPRRERRGASVARHPVPVGHHLAIGLEPGDVHRAADRPALEPPAPPKDRMRASQGDQTADVLEQRLIDLRPLDPGDLVVLAVRVVVAFLG